MKLVSRGGTWQVHFTDPSGIRQRLSTKVRVNPALPDRGKSAANLQAIERIREYYLDATPASERPADPARGRTLGYALQRTLDERWSAKKSAKVTRYRVHKIIQEVGYWPLRSVTYTRLNDYGQEMVAAGLSPATRNRRMSAIHTALVDAQLRGEIESVPPMPHWTEDNIKERYLTKEEESKLALSMAERAAPGDEEAQYMRRMVPFLLDTGLRAGEAILGAEQDLGETVWLPHGTTKSGKGRTVPLTPRARECLDYILASPVHVTMRRWAEADKDKPTSWMGRKFRLETKHAGIRGVTLHTLRHTCASRLVQAGISLYIVKEWLGHSSITVTERYAHLAPKSLDEAMRALAGGTVPAAGPALHTASLTVDRSATGT